MGLVEALNAVGVALSANPSGAPATQSLGSSLTIAALVIQLVVILVFLCLAALFHRRCVKAGVQVKSVKTLLATLYASMALILARCVYRLAEHTTGHTNIDLDNIEALRSLGPVLRYEVFFYVFEAALMLLNSALWNVWNPGRFLPRDCHVYLARDGTEVEGEEVRDGRSWMVRIASLATFGILFREKRKGLGFRELEQYPAVTS